MTADVPSDKSNSLFMLSAFPRESVRWLWPKRIPLGYLTLLAGEPQAGKSYLTLDIAARTSRGGPWPDGKVESQEPRASSPAR